MQADVMQADVMQAVTPPDAGPSMVRGDATGVDFPTGVDAFHAAGAAFLTRAFRATGALSPDNAVVEIVATKEFFGGGMGRKLWLDVRYARAEEGLHTALFAKFTREFGDPLRDLFSPVMQPEVRFALLSRAPDFPVRVPTCYFGDYSATTQSGLLITERVPYGHDGIAPLQDKCLDYAMADPLDHYQALTRAMAALAAHHRAGRFGAVVDSAFPFDRAVIEAQPMIPFDSVELAQKLARLRRFAAQAPQLLPQVVRDAEFLDGFCRDAMVVVEREAALRAHVNGQDAMIALCHWNMNVDNAWFWRDGDVLRCGLLDWGGVAQMSLAMAFVGMTCAAETDFLAAHEAELIDLLLADYRAAGGPAIDRQAFMTALKLSIALTGVAWMLDAPALVEAEIPDLTQIEDRFDLRLRDLFLPRAQLQLMTLFLDSWRRLDIGAAVRAI
jgi:hypothetical protein